MRFVPQALATFALLVLVSTTDAQWSTTSHNSANPIIGHGALVLHDDGTALRAFSAMSRRWATIAPGGSTLLGSGDWCALVQDDSGAILAYSARLDATAVAPIPPGYTITEGPSVQAELVFFSVRDAGGTDYVHLAWSAQTNRWAPVTSTAPVTWTITPFLVALSDGPTAHAFSARLGEWQSATIAPASLNNPEADGNVAVWQYVDAVGLRRVAAYSAVVGNCAVSPEVAVIPFSSWVLVDDDVAFVRARVDAGHFAACGYSAYTGDWITSSVAHDATTTTVTLSGRTILVHDAGAAAGWEALGARPAAAFASADASFALIEQGRDWIVLRDAGGALLGFSGVCGGSFVPEAAMGTPNYSVAPATHFVALDGVGTAHAFSAVLGGWATPLGSVEFLTGGQGGHLASVQDQWFGYSPRFSSWVPGPSVGGQCGSIVQVPPSGNDWWAWDMQRGEWADLPTLGFGAACGGGPTYAFLDSTWWPTCPFGCFFETYSFRTGDYSVAPPMTLPIVEYGYLFGEVLYLVDSASRLHAYSALDREHVWYDYPSTSEFQALTPPSAPQPNIVGASVQGEPGSLALWFLSAGKLTAPLSVPNIANGLWLDLAAPFLFVGPIPVGANGLGELRLPLPVGSAVCFQGWTQAALVAPDGSLSFTPSRPEGMLLY